MDITDFIRDRLAEDKSVAQGLVFAAKRFDRGPDFTGTGGPAAEKFWARFNPARILADVVKGERLLDLHTAEPGQHPDFCGHDKYELPCPTLRTLALAHADHQDFADEWARPKR